MVSLEEIKSQVRSGEISLVIEEIQKDHINSNFAKELFLFLYDYTNSFKNANTTADILVLAGKTLEFGISHDKLIVEKIKKTLSQMKLCSEVIDNTQLYNGGTIVGSYVPKSLKDRFLNDSCIGESFMNNLLSTVSGVSLCFLIIEAKEGTNKVLLTRKGEDYNLEKLKETLCLKDGLLSEGRSIDEIIEAIISN